MNKDLIGFDASYNLLPYDGQAYYYDSFIDEASYYTHLLDEIDWRHDEVVIFGKHIITARKVAWIADLGCDYRYSGVTKQASSWTEPLLSLKHRIEQKTGAMFNSCLLNLYHNGSEGMGWHSDDEPSLEKNAPIASLSFGAVRKFGFRHKKTKETRSLLLGSGSLLVMEGETQTHWHHSLLKSSRILTPRINLTFRSMRSISKND